MSYLNNTKNWIIKTHENIDEEKEYKTKRANNEDISMFKTRSNRCSRGILVPKHNIVQYDQTMYNFINETSAMYDHLNNRIIELEEKLKNLENK
jgi:hypothetical protein